MGPTASWRNRDTTGDLLSSVCAFVADRHLPQCSTKPIKAANSLEPAEFERSAPVQRLTLYPGERRGYWRSHTQQQYGQTIVPAEVDDRNARVLLDSGAETSILDSTFARKIGVQIDTAERLGCKGIGGSTVTTEGRSWVKVPLGDKLVYKCQVWVSQLGNIDAILGCDFLTAAGVRLDLSQGVALMSNEIPIQFERRKPLYSDKVEQVRVKQETAIQPGKSLYIRTKALPGRRLWLRRGEYWVATAQFNEHGMPNRLKVTNLSDQTIKIPSQTIIGTWLRLGAVSRLSRRYNEWCTLVYQVETDLEPATSRC